MGSSLDEVGRCADEGPVDVILAHGFWMLETPVTVRMWRDGVGEQDPRDDQMPATEVNWNLAKDYCQKLTDAFRPSMGMSTGWLLDLPTEAQWEYACRAGSTTRYCFADNERQLGDYAWFAAISGRKRHPVGLK
ncbi:MAG: SUMF1/EgtB/PvdO family nonheme iron enzyme, partial [Planctomycetota bacterium]|nr:SUMF1/EgtB/PvdO family nonheme iron enzyme [Planctomycetota bacterium]